MTRLDAIVAALAILGDSPQAAVVRLKAEIPKPLPHAPQAMPSLVLKFSGGECLTLDSAPTTDPIFRNLPVLEAK